MRISVIPFWIFKILELYKGIKAFVEKKTISFEGFTREDLFSAKREQFSDFSDESFLNAFLVTEPMHIFLPAISYVVNKLLPCGRVLYS